MLHLRIIVLQGKLFLNFDEIYDYIKYMRKYGEKQAKHFLLEKLDDAQCFRLATKT